MGISYSSEISVKKYLSSAKQEDIKGKIRMFLRLIEITDTEIISVNNIVFLKKKDMQDIDQEGYVVQGKKTPGRYCIKNKTIYMCGENMSDLVTGLERKKINREVTFGKEYIYFLCDLVFIHECMHAYQHQIENKELKNGDKLLEEEANRRAVVIFISMYDISDEVKKVLVDFFIQQSEFKFGNGFDVGEAINKKRDISICRKYFI